MDVHIEQEQEQFLQSRIDAGEYATPEEAVRAAIDLLEQQQERWTLKPGVTGAELVAALQASPHKEFDLEPIRVPLDLNPRDISF